jgi:hypothetical protein
VFFRATSQLGIFCVFNDLFWALIILNHSHGVILAVTFCLGHSEVAGFFKFFFLLRDL